MRVWWRMGGVVAVAGALSLTLAAARAETCALQLNRLSKAEDGFIPEEMSYRYVSSQGFFMQIQQGQELPNGNSEATFKSLVKKEPESYNAKHPLKCAAHLGSDQYCFVVDASKPDSEVFDRLLFDRNGNGDLTDDEPILCESPDGTFPRVDLTIDVDGKKADYAFLLNVRNYFGQEFQYVYASLSAAAYRTGEITLDGVKHKIVLVDFNSNGRFDDRPEINPQVFNSNGNIYVAPSDMLWVDPQAQPNVAYWRTTSGDQQYVSKLLAVGGKFYDMHVSPNGDELTLTPSVLPMGKVSNPNGNFRAVVYNDDGVFLKIQGSQDEPAAIPAGKWKLLEYTIDLTGQVEKEDREKKSAEAERSPGLFEAIARAVTGAATPNGMRFPSYTSVSAQATTAYKAVDVGEGKMTELPFGPPYHPVVAVSYLHDGIAELGLEIVGSAGENCTDLMVRGQRPDAPNFTLATKDGEKVTSGSFKYG